MNTILLDPEGNVVCPVVNFLDALRVAKLHVTMYPEKRYSTADYKMVEHSDVIRRK